MAGESSILRPSPVTIVMSTPQFSLAAVVIEPTLAVDSINCINIWFLDFIINLGFLFPPFATLAFTTFSVKDGGGRLATIDWNIDEDVPWYGDEELSDEALDAA